MRRMSMMVAAAALALASATAVKADTYFVDASNAVGDRTLTGSFFFAGGVYSDWNFSFAVTDLLGGGVTTAFVATEANSQLAGPGSNLAFLFNYDGINDASKLGIEATDTFDSGGGVMLPKFQFALIFDPNIDTLEIDEVGNVVGGSTFQQPPQGQVLASIVTAQVTGSQQDTVVSGTVIVPEIDGNAFGVIAFSLGALGLWLYSGGVRARREETPFAS